MTRMFHISLSTFLPFVIFLHAIFHLSVAQNHELKGNAGDEFLIQYESKVAKPCKQTTACPQKRNKAAPRNKESSGNGYNY